KVRTLFEKIKYEQ
ncbi:unnamed protein product, partial [Rotaria sordida]